MKDIEEHARMVEAFPDVYTQCVRDYAKAFVIAVDALEWIEMGSDKATLTKTAREALAKIRGET